MARAPKCLRECAHIRTLAGATLLAAGPTGAGVEGVYTRRNTTPELVDQVIETKRIEETRHETCFSPCIRVRLWSGRVPDSNYRGKHSGR
jgi:hypothetical protein